MSRREELIRQLGEWTRKYVEADNRLKKLLPEVADVSRDEKLEPLTITPEYLVEYDKVQKEVEEAQRKRREIMEDLSKFPPEKI